MTLGRWDHIEQSLFTFHWEALAFLVRGIHVCWLWSEDTSYCALNTVTPGERDNGSARPTSSSICGPGRSDSVDVIFFIFFCAIRRRGLTEVIFCRHAISFRFGPNIWVQKKSIFAILWRFYFVLTDPHSSNAKTVVTKQSVANVQLSINRLSNSLPWNFCSI